VVEIIIFTFEWSIRAEVVTYRFVFAFETLHLQELHGADAFHNDKGAIWNPSAKIDTTILPLRLPKSYLSFRFLRLAKIFERKENGKNRVFSRSD
jgi:hypothetical protein